MIHYSNSAAIINKRGGIGSPCLTPLLQLMLFPGTPFRRTEVVADSKMLVVHLIQLSSNPNLCIIVRMVECSIVSKVFVKSNFRMIISSF
jgi:hypothetical protein